ncbi:MAG: LysR family transcriptional regulator [Bacteroidota bacterium]
MAKQKDTTGKYSNIRLNYNIWISSENDEYILGDDIFRLLRSIHSDGSLSAAAKLNNISYRKVWGDLKECESKLGFGLIEKTRGGKDGGRTSLTDDGIRLLEAYNMLHSEFQKSVNEVIIDFKRTVKGKKSQ